MAADVTALYDAVSRDFRAAYRDSAAVQQVLKKLEKETLGYADITPYAARIGALMSQSLTGKITEDCLENGRLMNEIANGVVRPSLLEAYHTVAGTAVDVQRGINAAAGLSFNPVSPTPDPARISNLLERLTGSEYEKVEWLLAEDAVGSFTRAAVTDTIRENAKLHRAAGVHPYLARYAKGHCCEWCDSVSGVFEFGEQPDGFWRVHKHCTCVIEYKPSKYKQADIISYVTDDKTGVMTKEHEMLDSGGGSGILKLPDYQSAVIPREKFTQYVLDPDKDPDKARAFKDALGYTKENADELIHQIFKHIPECDAIEKGDNGYGMTYQVDMMLNGPNGKTAKVLTAWIKDKQSGETRLVTAHIDK